MRILVVAVAPLFASCNAIFPFNSDQACETQVRAACHFAYGCCNATERATFTAGLGVDGFRNEGECVDELLRDGAAECGNALAVTDAVNQNRFTYDAALAQKCLQPTIDALNQCQADKVFQPAAAAVADDPCAGLGFAAGNLAFGKGKVKDGKECFQSFECETAGSVCDVKPDDDVTDGNLTLSDVGTCKAPGKEGDDCSADTGTNGLCEEGTFCAVDNTCTAIDLKQNGEACAADNECETDFCNDIGGIGGAVCSDKLGDGEDCLDSNDCTSGLCQLDENGANGVCEAPPKLVVNACNGLQADDTKFAKQ